MNNIKIIQVRKNEGIEYKNIDMIVTAKAVAKKIISHGYNIVPLFPNAKNTNEPKTKFSTITLFGNDLKLVPKPCGPQQGPLLARFGTSS